jgi:hypothetical protein
MLRTHHPDTRRTTHDTHRTVCRCVWAGPRNKEKKEGAVVRGAAGQPSSGAWGRAGGSTRGSDGTPSSTAPDPVHIFIYIQVYSTCCVSQTTLCNIFI